MTENHECEVDAVGEQMRNSNHGERSLYKCVDAVVSHSDAETQLPN